MSQAVQRPSRVRTVVLGASIWLMLTALFVAVECADYSIAGWVQLTSGAVALVAALALFLARRRGLAVAVIAGVVAAVVTDDVLTILVVAQAGYD